MNPFDPINSLLLERSLELFSKVSVVVTGSVAVCFLMRAVFYQVTFRGVDAYASLFQDVIAYFALINVFPMLVKLLMQTVIQIAAKVGSPEMSGVNEASEKFFEYMSGDYVIMQIWEKIGDISLIVIVQSCYSIMIGLLLAIAPIVIFSSTILKLSSGIGTYFKILFATSMWPILWNLLGTLGASMWPKFFESPFRTVVYWSLIKFFQFLSPIFCISLFSSFSAASALGALGTIVGVSTGTYMKVKAFNKFVSTSASKDRGSSK
ncbi:hypothetical protein [Bdellovibrio sp. NC01]|uniref:hypothetical protein n=1 Tax=Bdellovibrio sp. NC01 TaxID=2220073 RepID=UPI001158F2F5|nr:hypothetical protein [Bdellovibrio sp. NC01]QDK37913.1 hypothetical protein DOE51_10120 [Bdellovibrio sp. NC01]